MATKPTTVPEWSSDQSNMTEPSAGQKQTGWTQGQDGVSDYDNWFKYWAYKWIEYLSNHTEVLSLYTILSMHHSSETAPGTTHLAYNDAFGYVEQQAGTSSGFGVMPLRFPVGAVLGDFRFRVADASGETWTITLYSTVDGVRTQIGTVTSAGSGSTQTLTLSGAATAVETGKGYYLTFTSTGTAQKFLYAAEADIS